MGNCWAKKTCDYAEAQIGNECGKTNKYSAEMDAINFYNLPKNGEADSCSIFVDNSVLHGCTDPSYDEDPEGAKWTALYVLNEPQSAGANEGAGCAQAVQYFKNIGAWYTDTKDYERGDKYFLRRNSAVSKKNPEGVYHTGIIIGWNEDGFRCVEGNTNGGMVAEKFYSYSEAANRWAGAGRPRYDGWEPEQKEEKPEEPVEKPSDPLPEVPEKSIEDLAREVINGDWGNGRERAERLEAAGYSYDAVQAKVNELLGISKPSAPAEKHYTVSVRTKLNVRYGPGMDYPIKYQLDDGDPVTVYETDGDWGRIGDEEWVCMDYLE